MAANDNPRGMSPEEIAELRKAVDQRLLALETVRWSWWQHWRLLARYIQPRLGRFLPTPNPGNRGSPKNQHIVNNTASIAAQRFGAGLLAGATSPARQWFKLRVGDGRSKRNADVKAWTDEVEKRMMHVFAESNFYRAAASCYEEIGVFGTAPMLIYEDFDDVIRCYPQAAGEYYLGNDHRLEVNTFARKFLMTIDQVVGRFGLEACSPSVQAAYRDNQLDTEIIVAHMIAPNDKRIVDAPGVRGFPWREVYWEWGQGSNYVLQVKGYHERPFAAPRWNVTSNDPYGRSPGMDALGDTIQLQIEEKRKAQAIDKVVNPPMLGDASLRNEPASTIPGGVTWIPPGAATIGFKPAYQIQPDIPALVADIQKCEERIKSAFFEDLFLMISQIDEVHTATDIAARKEEKMLMLGPALERLHNEFLGVCVERTFNIMLRAKLLPPAPASIRGMPLGVEFVSTLAQAQKAVNTVAIERTFAFAGTIAGEKPEIMDKLDADEAVEEYADLIGAPSKIIVPADQVAKIRQTRAQQQQMAVALNSGLAAAQGAQVLSKTDVGGGVNALQRMTGAA